MTNNNKMIGKEIHLKKRPPGFVTEDDFELVEVEVPEIKKEGEFLVQNPFMRIYMTNGSKIRGIWNLHHVQSCHSINRADSMKNC